MLATDIESAYKQCNPDFPLAADDPRYIDFASVWGLKQSISKTICRSIIRADDDYSKYLVSGHRGCGKSTELFQLKKCLEENNYLCIYMDIEDVIDPSNISYTDIFIGLVKTLANVSVELDINVNENEGAKIINWFNTEEVSESIKQNELNGAIESSIQAETGVPFLAKFLTKFSGQIKHGSQWRNVNRVKVEKKGAEFISLINEFIECIRCEIKNKNKGLDIVFIVDGLEKIHYQKTNCDGNTHSDLFVKQADQLKALNAHVIYTMPISLAYDTNLGNDFEDINILPMVNTNEQGQALLLELVKKRICISSVFEHENLVKDLIAASGGVARDLVRLIRFACNEVDDGQKIDLSATNMAITKLMRELNRIINSDDVPILKEIKNLQRTSVGSDRVNKLLLNRVVLEYQNGKSWAAIHPCALKIEWLREQLNAE